MAKKAFHHKHSLGQNFIMNDDLMSVLVDLADVHEKDNILEIGTGLGGMTKELARRCNQVITIEIDDSLQPILNVAFMLNQNIELVHGDVMKMHLPKLTEKLGNFHIVANIPYHITTPLITMLLSSTMPIDSMSFMLQKETAERLLAQVGEDGYAPITIKILQHFQAEIALEVPASMFTPPPKVDSAFLVMKRREKPLCDVKDQRLFEKVVQASFAMRRKTLVNNLMNGFRLSREQATQWLQVANLPENIRGEKVTIEEFATLSNNAPFQ